MNIFKRKHKIITGYETQSMDGAEVWVVSWSALERQSVDFDLFKTRRVAKAFLSEKDAQMFEQSIYDALILLQFAKTVQEAKYFSQLRIEKQS